MEIELHDGTVLEFPEGTSDDVINSVAKRETQRIRVDKRKAALPKSLANIQADTANQTALSGMSGFDRFAAGAGKAVTDLGRGAGQMLGLVSNEDVTQSRQTDAPLMDTTAGKVGNFAGAIGAAIPAAFIPGANSVAGAGVIGAGMGLLQPTTSAGERVTNTVLGGALGAGGQKVGQVVAGKLGEKIASRTAQAASNKAVNEVADETVKQAQKLGYSVPPTHANPTAKNTILESIGGKAQTQQLASIKNQRITDRLIREELGMGKDSALTPASLESVRKTAGKAYEAVAQSGDIMTDGQYLDELVELTKEADVIAGDFPELQVGATEEIKKLQNGLLKDKFNAKSAMELVKQLRRDASAAFRSGENPQNLALARAKREAAGVVEDMVTRHLDKSGRGQLAKDFDKARTLIAKTHSAEDALIEGTGHINAAKLAGELRKGKPLSGNLATIAKFAQAFPKAAAHPSSSAGVSAVDALFAGALGTTVDPSLFGIPLARIAARRAVLSAPYQNAMTTPSYAPHTALLGAGQKISPYGYMPGLAGANLLFPAEE